MRNSLSSCPNRPAGHYSRLAQLSVRSCLIASFALLVLLHGFACHAALTIAPTTWNVIGLDSNDQTAGPNIFPVGARVTNTGGAATTTVTATLVWDTTNTLVNVVGRSTDQVASIAPGASADFYFNAEITRTIAAFDTFRGFHIEASAAGEGTVSTPTPRQLYVDRLLSQSRNQVLSFKGPTPTLCRGDRDVQRHRQNGTERV